MGEIRTTKEQEMIENVLKAELDLITYVDVDTGQYHVIITNEETDVIPPPGGDYAAVNARAIPAYVHPDDQEECARLLELSNMQRELEHKEHMTVPYRLLCGDTYRRKELRICYHGKDKKTLMLVRRDVTDSYEAEQFQRERLSAALTKARRANQEKNEFLERMSHEIRTPMNSIIGLSYLTKECVGNRKQVLENLDKISRSARFLLSFVDDILNLSQTESGNVAMNRQAVAFEGFLEGIARETKTAADRKRIAFAMEKRGAFDREYFFDADQLSRALSNILQNAVKYTQPEGSVAFIVESQNDTQEETTIRFEIRDNGIGISAAFLPYIFEPFTQEEEHQTTLEGGNGLGLAIARNIIELMGGQIDAYSEIGNGSIFVVTVTLQKADCGAGSHSLDLEGKSDYDFTGKRALLVEDNEVNIEITRNILTHRHLAVDVAANGEEGVARYLEHEPGYYDVILMDIRMPVMDGLAATRKIRESGRADSRKIPIVAMTANVFEEDVRRSFEAGMDAHLSKPLNVRQLYDLLYDMIFGE